MPGIERVCEACRTRTALRRYCRGCSPRASALYKQRERRAAKAAGERYWLDWWVKTYGEDALAKRRDYQRAYMRRYRRRRREGLSASARPASTTGVASSRRGGEGQLSCDFPAWPNLSSSLRAEPRAH